MNPGGRKRIDGTRGNPTERKEAQRCAMLDISKCNKKGNCKRSFMVTCHHLTLSHESFKECLPYVEMIWIK
jgi:hypothetical protein